MPSFLIWGLVFLAILVLILFKISQESKINMGTSQTPQPYRGGYGWDNEGGGAEDDSEEDPELIEKINHCRFPRELMEIVYEYNFVGGENNAVLEKAQEFDLSRGDWEDILEAAEEDSELERIAEEKS